MAYNGRPIRGFNVLAVADIPLLFQQDLEQCADFAMRLWAEYHKRARSLPKFYLFDYNGNRRNFSASEKTLVAFLKWSFANTNSHSLKRGCAKVASEADLIPGDMLVQNENGGIGHVSVILDVCEKPGRPRLYLIGFSYMPPRSSTWRSPLGAAARRAGSPWTGSRTISRRPCPTARRC
jgi:hypothetical protein